MISSALTLAALALVARAADTQVHVGAFQNGTSALVFDPSSITAATGDTVTFIFHPKNHSVTQSTFAAPCTRMPVNATTGIGGVALGFHPATATDATLTTVTMQVNTTAPIWMFCGQTGHCGQGMVFSVNAPASGNTFEAYLANAKGTATAATGTTGTTGGTSAASGSAGAAGTVSTGTVAAGTSSVATAAGGASSLTLGAGAFVAVLASVFTSLA